MDNFYPCLFWNTGNVACNLSLSVYKKFSNPDLDQLSLINKADVVNLL